MLAVYIIQWAANTYRIRYTNLIGQKVIYDLRIICLRTSRACLSGFFDKRPAGSVLVRITNYVNSLQDLLSNGIINLLIDCVQLSGIVVILFFINVKLASAIIFFTVPLMFYISTSLRKRIRIAWQIVNTRQSRINAHLNESIQGIRVTQAYTQEKKDNMAFFEEMNKENRANWDRGSRLNQTFNPLIEVTGAIGYCILFWYGGHLIQSGEITVGLLVAFASYIGNFWEPITRLGQMYSQLLIAMASSERIFEFIDEQPTVLEPQDAKPLPPVKGDVSFENIVFEYEPGRPALRGISLDVKAGQSIALVGHTGSGKKARSSICCAGSMILWRAECSSMARISGRSRCRACVPKSDW